MPLEIVPVVAIGAPASNPVALKRVADLQRALLKTDLGWSNHEVWAVAPDGIPALLEL